MAILPSVGVQTGNRLAQMIASENQSQRAAGLDLRQLAFRQQLAAAQEREKKRMLQMGLLQQHAQKRERDRAARSSDVSMQNILRGMTTGASMGSAGGPWGMAIGAVAGGATGAFVDDEDAAEWARTTEWMEETSPLSNLGSGMGGGMTDVTY